MTRVVSDVYRGLAALAVAGLFGSVAAVEVHAQTMPAQVYFDLTNRGYEKLANRISKKLELRADPDDEDVQSVLDRWKREEGGPDSGWDHIAVTRLWLRAGSAAKAEMALMEAEASGEVPAPILLLDQARIAFLSGQVDLASEAYWRGCEGAGETAYKEYWLDIEGLATPEGMAASGDGSLWVAETGANRLVRIDHAQGPHDPRGVDTIGRREVQDRKGPVLLEPVHRREGLNFIRDMRETATKPFLRDLIESPNAQI